MKSVKITVLFLSCLSASCSIASANDSSVLGDSWDWMDVIGRWSPRCEQVSGVNIQGQNEIKIEVNSNQIYILSAGTITEDSLAITLKYPEDLGRGGMMLEWDAFSKTTPIAIMKLASESKAKFQWLGFYDTKLKSRAWVDEPDFLAVENDVFFKCKD